MASSAKERIPELIRERGAEFDRGDLAEVRALLALLPDPVEADEARGGVFETLWLVVADPRYKGDLKPSDL